MWKPDRLVVGIVLLVAVALTVVGCGGGGSPAGTEPTIGAASDGAASTGSPDGDLVRRIVVFKPDFVNEAAQEALVKKFGGQDLLSLPLIRGKVVLLPPTAEAALKNQPGVLRVDVDAEVHALGDVTAEQRAFATVPTQPAQVLPWGINRIDAEYAWPAGYQGSGVKVAVVDTGIDKTHPDLAAHIAGGVNFVPKSARRPPDPNAWNDDNGHGTHVAGIIGALDNTIGVVGVAPDCRLYAVKVLNKNGSGYVSWIISGLTWCINNGMQVVNMSLGTTVDVPSLHEACDQAAAAGIKLVAAAGNDGGPVNYPAAYSSVIAVAATDRYDARPYWSSYGPEIFVAAPGVSIYSTYKGSNYATMSGTSMAAPHVTGTLALNLAADLAATADDLPPPGKDVYTGWGLVDAEEAATGSQAGDNLP